MSNHLAIATVTGALHRMLFGALQADLSGATVSVGRPGAAATTRRGANLYLFNVVPNAAYRNAELPVRRAADAGLTARPQLALDLHYLVSCYGDDTVYEPQRVLGSVTRALHTRPVISRDAIRALRSDAAFVVLAGTDLHEQVELVRVAPLTLSLDDLSKLWSSMLQVPHAPSVAYQASVVLLEPDVPEPAPAPPVLERQLVVVQCRRPNLVRVRATGAEHVVPGASVRIEGENLQAEHVSVRVGGSELSPGSVADHAIEVTLPGDLALGLVPLSIAHGVALGRPATARPVELSNVVALIVHPQIASNASGPLVTLTPAGGQVVVGVTLTSAVAPQQEAQLELLSADERVALRLAAEASSAPSVSLTFQGAVAAGTYFVRVRVDGADSALSRNSAGAPTGPQVTVP